MAINFAVMLTVSISMSLLGITGQTGGLGGLLVLCAVMGFTGSVISLLLSKTIAKWTTGATVITGTETRASYWLVETVSRISKQAGIGIPEVAIYNGAPNAFATGAFKNSALVAVSSGLLETMSEDEIEGVLAHEISHIANGDMVTMTLLQGVLNTFVFFIARVLANIIDKDGRGWTYVLIVTVLDIVLSLLASMVLMAYSRHREYKADLGSSLLVGKQKMIAALERLKQITDGTSTLPKQMAAFGISGGVGMLLASHPSLDSRIKALKSY